MSTPASLQNRCSSGRRRDHCVLASSYSASSGTPDGRTGTDAHRRGLADRPNRRRSPGRSPRLVSMVEPDGGRRNATSPQRLGARPGAEIGRNDPLRAPPRISPRARRSHRGETWRTALPGRRHESEARKQAAVAPIEQTFPFARALRAPPGDFPAAGSGFQKPSSGTPTGLSGAATATAAGEYRVTLRRAICLSLRIPRGEGAGRRILPAEGGRMSRYAAETSPSTASGARIGSMIAAQMADDGSGERSPTSLVADLAPRAARESGAPAPAAGGRGARRRSAWRPIYAVWEITLRCDLACRHCGSRAGRARPDELDTAECLDLVRRWRSSASAR